MSIDTDGYIWYFICADPCLVVGKLKKQPFIWRRFITLEVDQAVNPGRFSGQKDRESTGCKMHRRHSRDGKKRCAKEWRAYRNTSIAVREQDGSGYADKEVFNM